MGGRCEVIQPILSPQERENKCNEIIDSFAHLGRTIRYTRSNKADQSGNITVAVLNIEFISLLEILCNSFFAKKEESYAREMLEIAVARLVVKRITRQKEPATEMETFRQDLGFFSHSPEVASCIMKYYGRFSPSIIQSAIKVDTPQPDWSTHKKAKSIKLGMGASPNRDDITKIGQQNLDCKPAAKSD